MNHLVGSYWVLSALPWWATGAILYFLCVKALFILRDIFEGFGYNTARSSEYGEMALIGIVLFGANIIKSTPTAIPATLNNAGFHVTLGFVAFALGVGWQIFFVGGKKSTKADAYHNLFVAPFLVYLLGITVPIVFWNGFGWHGISWSALAVVGLACLWGFFVWHDLKNHRLNQPKWFRDHSLRFPKDK